METRENTLSEREEYILNALVNDPDDVTQRRARALLEWSQDVPRETIARDVEMRPGQVDKLTRKFSQTRLELFAPAAIERASRGISGTLDINGLMDRFPTDRAHIEHVTQLALQLFDAASEVHQVPPEWRSVLEAGSRLHNLGLHSNAEEDSNNHHTSYDLILSYNLDGFSAIQRDVIASLALFHRKKFKTRQDLLLAELDPGIQRVTLALAALLRVANGLDSSRSQETTIDEITIGEQVLVTVSGPEATKDAARANKKADLWNEILLRPLQVNVQGEPPSQIAKARKPELVPHANEPIPRTARKLIGAQLARLRSFEDDVRAEQAADAVHDMRVASRRMKKAIRLTRDYLGKKWFKRLDPVLGDLRKALGDLRNYDVLLANLRTYQTQLEAEQRDALEPLLDAWEHERGVAHHKLVKLLDNAAYDEWVKQAEAFIRAKSDEDAPRVADVVPGWVWKSYGQVRKYEPGLKEAPLEELHALRIQVKRLRYTLEFFSEGLGQDAEELIQPLVELQDQLGNLQDAVVASARVAEFIAARSRHATRHNQDASAYEAAATYLASLQTQIQELRQALPDHWIKILTPNYRSALGRAVATL